MTDIYRNRPAAKGMVGTFFPKQGLAGKAATELRREGVASVIEKVTLKKMPKKDLLCALANRVPDTAEGSPFEKIEVIKEVAGVKKPKTKDGGP
jgi:hypothetical protein